MVKAVIPRFISRLNEIAASHGIKTSAYVGRFPDPWRLHGADLGDRDVILSKWGGTEQQFRATGLILPSYHFPLERGLVSTPARGSWAWGSSHPLIAGTVEVAKGEIVALMYGGDVPQKIEMMGEVEVCETSMELIYHGKRDALIASGACEEKHFPTKRASRSSATFSKHHTWQTRTIPDGSYVHWKESDAAYTQRMIDDGRIHSDVETIMARRERPHYDDGPPLTHLTEARQLLTEKFSLTRGPKWDWSRSI